ncbi:uncharacterized protein VP01_7460g1, partial [Puccinia sorghi]
MVRFAAVVCSSIDLTGAYAIDYKRGRNTLVKMSCCKKEFLALLDSGAVQSVVGKAYLEQFCPQWIEFVRPVSLGTFHSASRALIPLELVKVKLHMAERDSTLEQWCLTLMREVLRDSTICEMLDDGQKRELLS